MNSVIYKSQYFTDVSFAVITAQGNSRQILSHSLILDGKHL